MEIIKELLYQNKIAEAIEQLNKYIDSHPNCNDEPFYLLGNAWRKQGNWQLALNHYLEAIERNPKSPALSGANFFVAYLKCVCYNVVCRFIHKWGSICFAV